MKDSFDCVVLDGCALAVWAGQVRQENQVNQDRDSTSLVLFPI